MNKNDLKFGNVVEVKCGTKYLFTVRERKEFINLDFVSKNSVSYIPYEDIDEDLRKKQINNLDDIVKVYEDYTCSKILWERPQELLTQEEKEYLKALIMPFKDKVKSIMKSSNFSKEEYITINFDGVGDCMLLPFIRNMTLKFKGLKAKIEYTLKELGLEEY